MDNKKLISLGFIIILLTGMLIGNNIKSFDLITEDRLEEIKYNASMIGYNTALYDVLLETSKCEKVLPITFYNQTINLVAVECLNLNQGGNK